LNAGAHLRDVQDFARHADPKTTMRYDRNRHSLDRHATYAIVTQDHQLCRWRPWGRSVDGGRGWRGTP
jgi:hypothetical protein